MTITPLKKKALYHATDKEGVIMLPAHANLTTHHDVGRTKRVTDKQINTLTTGSNMYETKSHPKQKGNI